MLGLIAHRFERLVNAIDDASLWAAFQDARRPPILVAVSSRDPDPVATGDDVRARDESPINGTCERNIREAGSPDIAL
jgi:hypothetical protein